MEVCRSCAAHLPKLAYSCVETGGLRPEAREPGGLPLIDKPGSFLQSEEIFSDHRPGPALSPGLPWPRARARMASAKRIATATAR